ncbi:MAG: HlyD family type I secretion periplasmic adaptor subunit [Rhodospirillaceae bacterium]
MRWLSFVRDGETIRGKLAEDAAVLERAKSKLSEAETEIGAIQSTYDSDVRQTLEEARGELQELAERRRKFEDTLGRTVLRAPVDGIVKSQYFFTVGGVIRPGEVVLDLVPKDDRLVIEAKLMPQDVSYVFPGQTAVIRLASQEALRFGIIEGSVSEVSPDALSDDQGVPYFEVRILTEQDHFERDGQHYSLFPGMQVTAGIHTHSRTIFEYLAAPFMDGLDVALGER